MHSYTANDTLISYEYISDELYFDDEEWIVGGWDEPIYESCKLYAPDCVIGIKGTVKHIDSGEIIPFELDLSDEVSEEMSEDIGAYFDYVDEDEYYSRNRNYPSVKYGTFDEDDFLKLLEYSYDATHMRTFLWYVIGDDPELLTVDFAENELEDEYNFANLKEYLLG